MQNIACVARGPPFDKRVVMSPTKAETQSLCRCDKTELKSIVSVIATGSKAHTRLSPFVVKTTRPLLIAMPSPPANRFVSGTWLRVGVGTPDGSGTVAHASTPTESVRISNVPADRSPHMVGTKR